MKTIFFTMAYNAERTIERTIRSIRNQTCADWEYYILDNGAEDSTGEIINKYAKIDDRIKPVRLNKNDPTNGGALFCLLVVASDTDYIVWCDADDTYSPDFLAKMVNFAQENQLDIACCGYDMIDGETNALIKHRALTEPLIVYGDGFTESFVQYRGFMSFLWGKLYSVPFLRRSDALGTAYQYHVCCDTIGAIAFFKKADRIGVYNAAMYQYYQYPKSLSRVNLEGSVNGYQELWDMTKKYLVHFGPISKQNEDFLYAIYLSFVDEASDHIFTALMAANEKLKLLYELFGKPLWAETLARDADPQFRNLAARGEFVRQMKERVMALPVTQEEQCLAEAVVLEIDKLPKKSQ